jgi:hypothetical protein
MNLGANAATVSLESPPMNQLVAQPPFTVHIDEIDDWQRVLPDGRVRGGFTTRAQVILAQRAGREIPPTFGHLEGAFQDCLRPEQ